MALANGCEGVITQNTFTIMINYNKISEHDKELLHAAQDAMFCTDIDEDLAEDEEVRKYLHGRAVFLHHREEAWAGIL